MEPTPPPRPGQLAILFTDLKGSSDIARTLGNTVYRQRLCDPHFTLLEQALAAHHGREIGTRAGDSLLAIFEDVNEALACAIAMQEGLRGLEYTEDDGKTYRAEVRIGIHYSEKQVTPTDEGLRSHTDVNYTSRIMGLADGGQILLSERARDAAEYEKFQLHPWPGRRIRSWHESPQTVYELLWFDGQTSHEPGARYLPDWYRERNLYIPRPMLENTILDLYTKKTTAGSLYRLITLHGYGGMGKTRLALQCSLLAAGLFGKHLYYARLDAISDELLKSGEAKRNYLAERIGDALNLKGDPVTHEDLPNRLPTDLTLFVLDNFESVDSDESAELLFTLLENRLHLHLLVTGRETVKADDIEKALEIKGLADEEAHDLLIARIKMLAGRHDWRPTATDEAVLPKIMALTESIPLALELAAAQAGHLELPEIAKVLSEEPLGPMTETPARHRRSDRSERHRSLTRSLNWSYKLLSVEDQAALAYLGLFGAPFTREEALGCFPVLPLSSLQRLQEAALLRREEHEGNSLYSLLRPTRAYALARLKDLPDADSIRSGFIGWYRQEIDANGGPENFNDPVKRERLDQVWRNAIAAVEAAALADDIESTFLISIKLMLFMNHRALWSEAIPLMQLTLAIQEITLGTEHPDLANSLNNLGHLYQAQGRLQEAEHLYRRGLTISEKALEAMHPDIATSLNRLAGLYQAQGRFQEAEPLHKRALAIQEEGVGAEDSAIATSLNHLACLYAGQGRYIEAEPLHKRAIAIQEEALEEEHPHVAASLSNLALLYQAQGRYTESEPLYLRALAINEKVLGAEHPGTATCLNNLACLYENQGRYTESEPLYLRALAINEKVLGTEHPDVATSLSNLALLYHAQGRLQEAEPLYLRALAINEKIAGAEHPDTAACLNNLANLYRAQGRLQEAAPLVQRSLSICENVLGEKNPTTATVLGNLAGCYEGQEKYSEAELLYKRALAIQEVVLGTEHPDIATSLNNLAGLYNSQGNHSMAEDYYQRALAINEKMLGTDHPDTAASLNNLAYLYQTQGRLQEALPLIQQALAIREKTLGQEHPATANSLNNLAQLYMNINRYGEAEALYKRALSLVKDRLGANHPHTVLVARNYASLLRMRGRTFEAKMVLGSLGKSSAQKKK